MKAQENDCLSIDVEVKQKLVRTAELEAEAEKARQVKSAEAQAQAKVIDGKAELERRKLMSLADGDRVQVMSKADADKLPLEAGVLKDSPILLPKIIADKLSDKVQIMMVPSDGKFFFANDVLRGSQPAVIPVPQPQDR